MRIRGGTRPEDVSVCPSAGNHGMSEVRVREKAKEVTVTDEVTNDTRVEWEYDEYLLTVPTEDNLKEKVMASLPDWLVTGKENEVAHNATKYVDAQKTAIDDYTMQLMEEGVV